MYQTISKGSLDPRHLPVDWVFDAKGVQHHARIQQHHLRAEQAVLDAHAQEIAAALGPRAELVVLATGDGIRTAQLVTKLAEPARVVLVDRAPHDATRTARLLSSLRPDMPTVAVDGVSPWEADVRGSAFFLGGSIIGELEPRAARARLRRLRDRVAPGGHLLVGIDLKKDARAHAQAYAEGAPFAKNALVRINDELGGTFDVDGFDYEPFVDTARSRVELRLVSKRWQWAAVSGRWFHFDAGEAITVTIATKYTIAWFAAVASLAGWKTERVFLDPKRTYALALLNARPGSES